MKTWIQIWMRTGLRIFVVLVGLVPALSGCGALKQSDRIAKPDTPVAEAPTGSPADQSDDTRAGQPEEMKISVSGNSYYLFMGAEMAKKQGDLNAAIELMRRAMEKDPASLYLKKELAILYLHKKEYDKALDVVDRILEQTPDSVDALLMSATIRRTMDKTADVSAIYEKVLEIDPDLENVYQLLGKLYFTAGDMDSAFRVYDKLVSRFPENYVGYYYLGEIYGVRGDYEKAEAMFTRTLSILPSLNEARLELIKLYRLTGQAEKTADMYRGILDQEPDNIVAAIELALYDHEKDPGASSARLADLGRQSQGDPNVIGTVLQYLVLQKRLDDALIILNGMAQGATESAEIAYAAGIVQYEKENLEKALAQFRKIEPDSRFYENAVLHMAIIYYKTENTDQGIAVLEKGLGELPPESAVSLIPYLSSLYREKDRTDDAIAVITEGLAVEPENTELLFDLGVIFDRQGKTDQALEQMRHVLALEPEHPDALNYIGYTYADQGIRLDEAEAMIKKALSYKPDNGYIIDSLGWVYFKKGMFTEALAELRRAAELIPDDPVLLEHLGDAYLALDEHSKALNYYEKALEKKDRDKEPLQKKIDALREQGW
jgi:tetratricopeptide (TPR) repeat protein